MKKIYVGNLGSLTSADQLQALFEGYGKVLKSGILCNHTTGEPLGFAYVVMSDDNEGNDAIQDLNGASLNGRLIDVREALPPEERDKNEKRFRGVKVRSR
jgi:RNA recognition motif-containing protein